MCTRLKTNLLLLYNLISCICYMVIVKDEWNVFTGKWTSKLTLKSLFILVDIAPPTVWYGGLSIKWHASKSLAVVFVVKLALWYLIIKDYYCLAWSSGGLCVQDWDVLRLWAPITQVILIQHKKKWINKHNLNFYSENAVLGFCWRIWKAALFTSAIGSVPSVRRRIQ